MSYVEAKEKYLKYDIDTEKAIKTLGNVPISIHCWQGDDVIGFDSSENLSGGIQTTGNYPGRARNFDELVADYDKAFSLIGGKKKLNLHACYAVFEMEMCKVEIKSSRNILPSGLNLQRREIWESTLIPPFFLTL